MRRSGSKSDKTVGWTPARWVIRLLIVAAILGVVIFYFSREGRRGAEPRRQAKRLFENGIGFIKQGDPLAVKKGVDQFQLSADTDPSFAPPNDFLADIYLDAKRHTPAKKALLRLQQYNPQTEHIYCRFAETELLRSNYDAARPHAEEEVRRAPNCFQGHYLLGSIMWSLFHEKIAVEQFRLALEIKPEDANALLKLAEIVITNMHYDEGEELAKRLLTINPTGDEAQRKAMKVMGHYYLGFCYERNNKIPDHLNKAKASLLKAIQLNSKHDGTHHELGRVYMQMNRFEEGEGITVGNIIKGVVMAVNEKQVSVFLGPDEGTIDILDMNWARPPNTRLDGRWAKIKRPSEALYPGDLIWVKPLRIIGGGLGWALALEQEPRVEGSLVSLDPKTGQVKAMVGGYSFSKSQFNRAVQAIRQPGSAFKPLIYAAAIKEGYSPSSIIIDSPIIFKEKEDAFDKWKPVNFEEKFYGPTSLRTALTHSRNVVTVKLMQNIGVKGTIKLAKSLGITSKMEKNLSISLGSAGVTLFQLTSAYSAFANNGTLIKPDSIRNIQNRKGEILYASKPEITQPISPGVAYTITSLLQSVVEHGTGKKVKALNRPVAGKTGTTNNFVDAWFMGYTPELVTGVWVGKDKDESLGRNETGSRAAIPIWLQFMQEALVSKPITNFQAPSEIQYLRIRPEVGEPASFNEPGSRFEIFLQDYLPDNVQPFPENFLESTF